MHGARTVRESKSHWINSPHRWRGGAIFRDILFLVAEDVGPLFVAGDIEHLVEEACGWMLLFSPYRV